MSLKNNARNLLAAVIVVGVLESFAVGLFHYFQRQGSRAAICLAHIHAIANRLDALEWKAVARGKLEPDIVEEVSAKRVQLDADMARLSRIAEGCFSIRDMRRTYDVYIRAVDKEFDHLRRGELQKARWHDEQRVDPAFRNLQSDLQRNETLCEAHAEKFNRWDTRGTFLSLALASGVLLVLLQKFLRAQELAAKAMADRQLLEVYRRTEAEVRELNANLELRVENRTAQLRLANDHLEKEIAERHRLENAVQQVSEQEKQRLGQDLHDGLGQLLTGAAMRSKALENRLRFQELPEAEDVMQVTQLVAESLRMTRNMAWLLYPVELEKNGLVGAIQALATKLHHQFGVPCIFRKSNGIQIKDATKTIHLYRIVQEAVTNALRHGNASLVLIQLSRQNEEVALVVENDGPVIRPTETLFNGMGCQIMKNRASMIGGVLQIMALHKGGCRVTCSGPFH